jgi:hypothetical protein
VTPTLRRLNDRERYWGLTWPGWIAAAGAGGVLYGAIELSPFGFKPTVTVAVLLLALFAMILLGVSGQALSPVRQLQAIVRYRRSSKRWALSAEPDKRGLVLSAAPSLPAALDDDPEVDGGHGDAWEGGLDGWHAPGLRALLGEAGEGDGEVGE